MFELLTIGTIWFWILISIAAIFIFISLEYDDWGGSGATTTMLISGLLLWFFGGRSIFISIWDMLTNHTGEFFAYVSCYIFIGVIWSFVKWYFYLLNTKESIQYNLKHSSNYIRIPKASEHKGAIISWMCYWPFSGIWTLINDPVKRFFKWVYSRFENVYQKMSDKMFADIKDQLKG